MRALRVWTCLCLLSLTASCADQRAVVKTEYQPVYLPDRFLRQCPVPKWSGETYRDVATHALRIKSALETCNLQLDEARRYQDGIRAGVSPIN